MGLIGRVSGGEFLVALWIVFWTANALFHTRLWHRASVYFGGDGSAFQRWINDWAWTVMLPVAIFDIWLIVA